LRLEKPGDAARVIREAIDMPGPVLVEPLVDPFEPVMPGTLSGSTPGKATSAKTSNSVSRISTGGSHAGWRALLCLFAPAPYLRRGRGEWNLRAAARLLP
jgi:hypothetical protein